MAPFASPASSPARSPISAMSPPKTAGDDQELTPRSKVRAMLAAIDDEDSENAEPPRQAEVRTTRMPLGAVSGNQQNGRNLKRSREQSLETDSGDELPVRPQGKLAARLLTGHEDPVDENDSNEAPEDGNAYERIKRKLLTRKSDDPAPTTSNNLDGKKATETTSPRNSPSPAKPVETTSPAEGRAAISPIEEPSSPGLFRSPLHTASSRQVNDDEVLQLADDDNSRSKTQSGNNRFLELVAKKRAEREAREAEEDRKKEEKYRKRRDFERTLEEDASASSDGDSQEERRLTQRDNPVRKASKKALEEMNRETQRMRRNMQLAHQARTKRKITKDSLLARFNVSKPVATTVAVQNPQLSSSNATSRHNSDAEEVAREISPPTSPMQPEDTSKTMDAVREEPQLAPLLGQDLTDDESDHLTLDDLLSENFIQESQKGKAADQALQVSDIGVQTGRSALPKSITSKFKSSEEASAGAMIDLDSDSDVEHDLKKKSNRSKKTLRKLELYGRKPLKTVTEERALLKLRALSYLNTSESTSRSRKPTMTLNEMQSLLQRQARQQALEERNSKIEQLKAKGAYIPTNEEREKDQVHVEDLLEKARQEAAELQQEEKKAKRAEKLANGEVDGLNDSSDEDEDYEEGQEEEEIELSGSDDGEDLQSDEDAENDDASAQGHRDTGGMLDDEASEDSNEDEEAIEEGDVGETLNAEDERGHDGDDDTDAEDAQFVRTRNRRTKAVLDDDEEDDEEEQTHDIDHQEEKLPQQHESVVPSPHAEKVVEDTFFGLNTTNASLGLTQAFAATMANTQGIEDDGEDSMSLGDGPPEPVLPTLERQESRQIVLDSQGNPDEQDTYPVNMAESGRTELDFTQSQIGHSGMSETQAQLLATQASDVPEPTQDAGFMHSSPAPERFKDVPPSTAETLPLSHRPEEASPVKKRGRLHRRQAVASDSEDGGESVVTGGKEATEDAFAVMKEKRKKAAAQAAFNKKKSEAKEMVEEQAQESEDEYAGLGGASDDDSGGEEDEDVRKMMDHGDVNVNERALAALHADTERVRDEKAIEKLYKDINNGGLRRKRGNDLDLSDSDDDAEARRRRKQREFNRMRKALLADENVGKIAEDPKKMAFLRAIEDREDDQDFNFLEYRAEESFVVESMQQENEEGTQTQQPDGEVAVQASTSRTVTGKQPLREVNPNTRPPAAARRTAAAAPGTQKPATLADIRQAVSFLTETPGASDDMMNLSSSDIEPDEEGGSISTSSRSGQQLSHPRRTRENSIIDRLSLKRSSTASSSATDITISSSTSAASRLAFHLPSGGVTTDGDGFKVPSLLRRATTQVTNGSNGTADVTTSTGSKAAAATKKQAGSGFGAAAGNGTGRKCSSINRFAREEERRSLVANGERRRREEREKRAREGRKQGGLGRLIGVGSGAGAGGVWE